MTHKLHYGCINMHPESYKLSDVSEVAFADKVFTPEQVKELQELLRSHPKHAEADPAAAAATAATAPIAVATKVTKALKAPKQKPVASAVATAKSDKKRKRA